MKQKIDNSSGFTLVEVLIAAILLLVGLLAMGTFLGNLVTQNASNQRKTMATSIAEQKIEDLRTMATQGDLTEADSSDQLPNTPIAINISGAEIGPSPAAGEIYTLTWEIQEDFTGLADQIMVKVDWEATGNSELTMFTLINN